MWMYEGGTTGQTFLYLWIPSYDIIITINNDFSNGNIEDDPIANLAGEIFTILYNSQALQNYRNAHGMPVLDATQLQQLQSSLKFPGENGLRMK